MAILLLLSPLLLVKLSLGLFLVFLQLPIYMLHQYEEHSQGEFKAYVNKFIADGAEVLTDRDIFYINILLVWMLDVVVLYLANYINLAYGLIAVYLTVLNGIFHIGMGIMKREYNPGLWTSIFMFLPVGGYSIYAINQNSNVLIMDHVIGVGITILGHAAILIRIRQNLNKIRS